LKFTELLGHIMIPWIHLGTAQIPNDGGELKLSQRGEEFSIRLSGIRGELMNSRLFNSEIELSRLGCAYLKSTTSAQVLVGGLGMGYTLAEALKMVDDCAQVTVAELIPEVVSWNQGPLGECAKNPLKDPRTKVYIGDVKALLNSDFARCRQWTRRANAFRQRLDILFGRAKGYLPNT
jgi:spermidine synthase